MTRRPSQREKYPSLRAEKDKQHIRFRPQANQDEALITAYIKERKDEVSPPYAICCASYLRHIALF